jgi:hypothetical protein
MKLYHGAPTQRMTVLKESDPINLKLLAECRGIYFTADQETAAAYAGNDGQVYSIDFTDWKVIDLATKQGLKRLIEQVLDVTYHEFLNKVDYSYVLKSLNSRYWTVASFASDFSRYLSLLLTKEKNVEHFGKWFLSDLEDNLEAKIAESILKADVLVKFNTGVVGDFFILFSPQLAL